jgi:hypothetical protein
MSATPTQQTSPGDGAARWLVGLAGVIAAAAVVAGWSAVMKVERLEVRVDQLEKDKPALLDVGTKLGALTEKIGALKDTVDEIRKDQRASDRRISPK